MVDLNSSQQPEIVIAVVVGTFMLIYLWYKRRQGTFSFSKCNSPECVRCSKYEELNRKAKTRLQHYLQNKGESSGNIHRIKTALAANNVPLGDQRPNVLYIPELTASPWWSEEKFTSEVKFLEKSFSDIYSEYKHIMNDYFNSGQGWVRNDTPNGQWSVYFFYNQGVKVTNNCAKCPKTVRIIESLPAFQNGTVFGNASFSLLHPGTLITEHYGPTNTRIRCHLGLAVPDSCQLTVNGKAKEWQTGKCLLFDDSFLHSAYNMVESPHSFKSCRGVFMIDFWHPDLSITEKEAIKATYYF